MHLFSLIIVLSVATLAAWLSGVQHAGKVGLWLLIASLLLMLGYHLWCLLRVYRWAARPDEHPVPHAWGLWGHTLHRLSLHLRQQAWQRQATSAELERLYAAVDQVPEGLVVLDQVGHVQWSNRAAQDWLGIFGTRRPIDHFIRHPDFIAYFHAGNFAQAVLLNLPHAPERTYALKIEPTTDTYRLLICHDVTTEVRTDQMRRDFVANVSHEIRTPLTVIAGFIETLLEVDLPAATQRECLSTVQRQTSLMQRLIEDLLTLSTIEHATATPAAEPIAMTPLLQSVAADMQALSGHAHQITWHVMPPDTLLGTPSEIESALRNLATNAVRYTPTGGSITLRWHHQTDTGVLSVTDTGVGIAPEHLPRLTERFYRVDQSRSRDSGGTGLGLAIVKHVAQRHQALLQIESTPGQGSTFSVRFPKARVPHPRTAPTS